MSSKPVLRVGWCSHEAAKYAVTRWHYSKVLPPFPHVRVGAWEAERFIGVIVFARGATEKLCAPYGVSKLEGCELVRVAMNHHATPVSRIMAIALRMLKREQPKLRIVVSFADPNHGHTGGIYQAGGWIYAGTTSASKLYRDSRGKLWHERMIAKSGIKKVFGKRKRVLTPSECVAVAQEGKYRYLMPLDAEMRERVAKLSQPYPKRPKEQDAADHAALGGATPTRTLQPKMTGKEATRAE